MHYVQVRKQLLVPGIRHGQIGVDLRPYTPLTGIFKQRYDRILHRLSPEHRLSASDADRLQMLHFLQTVQHILQRQHFPFFHSQAVANRTMLTAHIA
ncbi:hypothetical protein D3C71_1891500 [compost metagenome]